MYKKKRFYEIRDISNDKTMRSSYKVFHLWVFIDENAHNYRKLWYDEMTHLISRKIWSCSTEILDNRSIIMEDNVDEDYEDFVDDKVPDSSYIFSEIVMWIW